MTRIADRLAEEQFNLERILERYAAGDSLNRIARECGMSNPRDVSAVLKAAGATIRNARFSADDDARMIALEGRGISALERAFPDRTTDAVKDHYRLLMKRGIIIKPMINVRLERPRPGKLSDEALWRIVLHSDDPTFDVQAFAKQHDVTGSAIYYHRRRIMKHGWTCALWPSTCPICQQVSFSRTRQRHSVAHKRCVAERNRQRWARQRRVNRLRGITSTRYVATWRARHPDRDAILRRKEKERRQETYHALSLEERRDIVARAHLADATGQEVTIPDAHQRGTRWTTNEDQYLIEHINDAARDVALALGRTLQAVKGRRRDLRQRGSLEQQRTTWWRPLRSTNPRSMLGHGLTPQQRSQRTARRHRDPWYHDDDRELMRLVATGASTLVIATRLKRTTHAIDQRIHYLRTLDRLKGSRRRK